ncbi:hypothetical protein SDJN02_02779, partial [Cucurbita argyrosperma subsp. argyrosperma]
MELDAYPCTCEGFQSFNQKEMHADVTSFIEVLTWEFSCDPSPTVISSDDYRCKIWRNISALRSTLHYHLNHVSIAGRTEQTLKDVSKAEAFPSAAESYSQIMHFSSRRNTTVQLPLQPCSSKTPPCCTRCLNAS